MAVIDVRIPHIGDFERVPIVEVQVKPGDVVKPEDPLLTLESDKAAMDVPAPVAGRVKEILAKIGDMVSEGTVILRLETEDSGSSQAATPSPPETKPEPAPSPKATPARSIPRHDAVGRPSEAAVEEKPARRDEVLAGPAARRLARELGVDLHRLKGSGDKGRVTKEDVKLAFAAEAVGSGASIPSIPGQDFGRFGPVETKPLSRLQTLSGAAVHRSWLNVPHVTHADETDITELEAYRRTLDSAAKEKGYRVTLLAFLLKASVVALKEFPVVNSSLAPDKASLILKRYYHLGVAVDTPNGLVVPVIKDVDRKGIVELSQELGAVSQRMREGRITPKDIEGATFSISSLGGIGGTGFAPIANAPEVAILGVARAIMKPVWDGAAFQPRLTLPLNLSYDHRVVDGALAARFARRLAETLADMRQLIL